MTEHQDRQREIIDKIAEQVDSGSLEFSTVEPVDNFETDPRICLTSVHMPGENLIMKMRELTEPLRELEPEHFYYPNNSLHITIKNVRVINDPPHFTEDEAKRAHEVFAEVIPRHKRFQVYFYRLILFPTSLAIVGTTDPELDNIILELDKKLRDAGVPDDKSYVNSKYFFCNMTLARFRSEPTQEYRHEVAKISESLSFEPYAIDSVSLVTANAAMLRRSELGSWGLS